MSKHKIRKGFRKIRKFILGYKYKRNGETVIVPSHFRTYYTKVKSKMKKIRPKKFPLLMALIAAIVTYYGFSQPRHTLRLSELKKMLKKIGVDVPIEKVDKRTFRIRFGNQKAAETIMKALDEKNVDAIDMMFVSNGDLYVRNKEDYRIVE